MTVAREHVAAARRECAAADIGDTTARLSHDEGATGDVPRLQISFPETIHPSGGNPAQIDGGRSQTTHGARLSDECAKQADNLVDPGADVVRKPGDEQRIDQLASG